MSNKDKIILDLCGGSGAWSKPYADAGYKVIVITLPKYDITAHYKQGEHLVFPVSDGQRKTWVPINEVYGILAAPPCTYFSRASRTRAKTPRDLKQGMVIVRICMNIIWIVQEVSGMPSLKFWALENPMGSLRRFLGRPKYTFNPSDFGDYYTKQTDLWGWFNEPKKRPIKLNLTEKQLCKENKRKLPSISDFTNSKQSAKRAITPPGFAKAFFESNQ